VRSIADQELVLGAGRSFAYSNTAYEVLGDVIAKKSSGEVSNDYVHITSA
jgi:CubicO group peptidase (beta-lactamase class C family)